MKLSFLFPSLTILFLNFQSSLQLVENELNSTTEAFVESTTIAKENEPTTEVNSYSDIFGWLTKAMEVSSNWLSNATEDTANWISSAKEDTTNWITNTTEDTTNWIAYIVGKDSIKLLNRAGNETGEWVIQTALDRDVLLVNTKENIEKWVDDAAINATKWIEGTVYQCSHRAILVKIIVAASGDIVGGVLSGGPNGIGQRAVEHCVERVRTIENQQNEKTAETNSIKNE